MIKMEDINGIEKIITHNYGCVIYQNIEVVWDFIKDVEKSDLALKDLRSKIEYTKGSSSFEVGAEYNFFWNNYRRIYTRIDEVVEMENYKKIVQHIKSEPTEIEYTFIFHFYKISIDDSTCLKWEIIYGEGTTMKKSQIEVMREERDIMMKKYAEYLNKEHFYNKKQVESFIYECKLKDLWKILTNWRIFNKLVPEFFHEIYQKDENNFIISWDNTGKKVSSMKVLKRLYNEKENICEYNLLCYNNPPEIPNQEIHFKFIKINSNSTMLVFKHVFLDMVDMESINKVSERKKKLIINLKKAIIDLKVKKKVSKSNNNKVNNLKENIKENLNEIKII